jgi:3-dehydro-L-gulonate 2-dehydrogenase
MSNETVRIQFSEMQDKLETILCKYRFPAGKAQICARIITESTCDGVLSHGLARFPRLINQTENGEIDPQAEPELVNSQAASEQWDGRHGIGIYNAVKVTDSITARARENGIAIAGLRNTSHWLRAGTYGWRAVEQGCAFICWTNTIPIMPAWNSGKSILGNNPLVIAVPSQDGNHIVLDMAMAQYSYGKLDLYRRSGSKLPYPGGYNKHGKLTIDPSEILETGMPLPVGYWKGSAMAFVLDMLAAVLSDGKATMDVDSVENDISQVFIAIPLTKPGQMHIAELLKKAVTDFASAPDKNGNFPRYPGQNIPEIRKENIEKGIPVPARLWNNIAKY